MGEIPSDEQIKAAIQAWLAEVLKQTGLKPTILAREIGVSSSTLTRMMSADATDTISTRTVAKIVGFTGIPLPPELGGGLQSPADRGDTDPEIMVYALAIAREMIGELLPDQRAAAEAAIVAEAYDALRDRERDGEDLERAAETIKAFARRRLRSGAKP
jgi:transcriptional regulator with XRE-family HTH domain